jgi:hypothetical protein
MRYKINEFNIWSPIREAITIVYHRALNRVGIYACWWAGFLAASYKLHFRKTKPYTPKHPSYQAGFAEIAYYHGYGFRIWLYMTEGRLPKSRRKFPLILQHMADSSRRIYSMTGRLY